MQMRRVCAPVIDSHSNKRLNDLQACSHHCRSISAMTEPSRVPNLPEVQTHASSARAGATRETLLDTAEALFSTRGFAGVSVRDITQAAGVNLAAIHYHFGGKDELALAVFERRARELSRERLAKLRAVMAGDAPSKRAVFHALLSPPLEWMAEAATRRHAISMLIRTHLDGSNAIMQKVFRDVSVLASFADALIVIDPVMRPQDANMKVFFALGLEHEIILNLPRLESLEAAQGRHVDRNALLSGALDLLAG
jgi:AcrR family transcriptional regulator